MSRALTRRALSRGFLSAAFFTLLFGSSGLWASPPSLFISAESVLSLLKRNQDIALVDVRSPDAFEKHRVPGSIRIPLFAIKTKPFLKSRLLVLVAEGHPDRELDKGCRALREAGFEKAFILSGGLKGWLDVNGPVSGDQFSLQELSLVTPQIFHQERDSPEWLIVDGSLTPTEPAVPKAVHVPFAGRRDAFQEALKKVLENTPGPSQRGVLIFDERGEHYAAIESLVRKGKIKRVFYLSGGREAYRVFQAHREASQQTQMVGAAACTRCP